MVTVSDGLTELSYTRDRRVSSVRCVCSDYEIRSVYNRIDGSCRFRNVPKRRPTVVGIVGALVSA